MLFLTTEYTEYTEDVRLVIPCVPGIPWFSNYLMIPKFRTNR